MICRYAAVTSGSVFSQENSTVLVNQCKCEGAEEFLLGCKHLVTTDCGISQMAGVVCVENGRSKCLIFERQNFLNFTQLHMKLSWTLLETMLMHNKASWLHPIQILAHIRCNFNKEWILRWVDALKYLAIYWNKNESDYFPICRFYTPC